MGVCAGTTHGAQGSRPRDKGSKTYSTIPRYNQENKPKEERRGERGREPLVYTGPARGRAKRGRWAAGPRRAATYTSVPSAVNHCVCTAVDYMVGRYIGGLDGYPKACGGT